MSASVGEGPSPLPTTRVLAAVASGGEAPPSCRSRFLLGALSPGRPARKAATNVCFPTSPNCPARGVGAGKPQEWPSRGVAPAPHSWTTFLYFNSTFVGPAHQKTDRMRGPSRKWKCPIWGAPQVQRCPEHLPRARSGDCLHRGGLFLPETLSLPSLERSHHLQPGK